MSLCQKCNDLIQSAAANSITKKRKELEKSGFEESGKIMTDPFVIMWVPEPEKPRVSEAPKYYPPDPYCTEYDYVVDLSTGAQECKKRVYPIVPRKPKNNFT